MSYLPLGALSVSLAEDLHIKSILSVLRKELPDQNLTPADFLLLVPFPWYSNFFDLSLVTLLRHSHKWCLNFNILRSLNPLTVYYWPLSPEPWLYLSCSHVLIWSPVSRSEVECHC